MFCLQENPKGPSRDIEGEIKGLHANVGELTVLKDFLKRGFKIMSRLERKHMIDRDHAKLSVSKQCGVVTAKFYTFLTK